MAESETKGNETFKILVVDDEITIQEMLLTYLESKGYEVQIADTGLSALEVSAEFKPHIVLLDIRMPDMDGIQCLRMLLKQDSNIAVVMMSGFATENIARKSLELGAFDYINKPISLDHLFEVIHLVKITKFVEYM